jgi:hypothetical protein
MPRAARNVLIIAVVALVIVAVPGGRGGANLIIAVISLGFLAAIAWLGRRLYLENSFTLLSLTTRQRALLYGAIALAFMTLVATPRLWETGIRVLAWFVLLGAAAGALSYVWNESRRYGV